MDVYFVLNSVTFVWSEDKARGNPQKHDGVTFQQATESFFDARKATHKEREYYES